jgi:hypothetical protein
VSPAEFERIPEAFEMVRSVQRADAMGTSSTRRVITTWRLSVALVATFVASPMARAATADASAVDVEASKVRLAFTLVPEPFGVLKSGFPGSQPSVSSVFAFAVMPVADFTLYRHFFFGLAPCYTFNVRANGSTATPAHELDLLVRIGGQAPITDRLQLYGYLSPGYSYLRQLPEGNGSEGIVVGLHGGGMFDVTTTFFVNAEIGYQEGFQRATIAGLDGTFGASFLQIGVGAGVRI